MRNHKKPVPDEMRDEKYFQRRQKNNMAAKKSRDQRKFRETNIFQRAEMLENENSILKAQLSTLKEVKIVCYLCFQLKKIFGMISTKMCFKIQYKCSFKANQLYFIDFPKKFIIFPIFKELQSLRSLILQKHTQNHCQL